MHTNGSTSRTSNIRPDKDKRWVAVGSSSHSDAASAGRAAAAEAVGGRNAGLVVVFCADSYDLEDLLGAVNESTGGAPLIGCSTAGEIATNGLQKAGVVVTALGGDGFSVATAAAPTSEGLREAGESVASTMEQVEDRPHRVLVLLTDGLAGDQTEIVRGAYSVLGAKVPLVGGCAGDDLKMQATYQFHGNEVLTGAVVAAALSSDSPLGIGVRHGWQRVGEPMVVTGSSSNTVHSLEDQPALDLYLERLNAPPEARVEGDAFTKFAQTHPLGLDRRAGEDHVRLVFGADFEDRSLKLIAEAPKGVMLWFMEGDDGSILDATEAACEEARNGLGGTDLLGLIAFDCIARRTVLGDEGVGKEIDRISEQAAGVPFAGFYSYGEIARTRGASGFHNQTLVVLAVS